MALAVLVQGARKGALKSVVDSEASTCVLVLGSGSAVLVLAIPTLLMLATAHLHALHLHGARGAVCGVAAVVAIRVITATTMLAVGRAA